MLHLDPVLHKIWILFAPQEECGRTATIDGTRANSNSIEKHREMTKAELHQHTLAFKSNFIEKRFFFLSLRILASSHRDKQAQRNRWIYILVLVSEPATYLFE